jgi:hypothetical protein
VCLKESLFRTWTTSLWLTRAVTMPSSVQLVMAWLGLDPLHEVGDPRCQTLVQRREGCRWPGGARWRRRGGGRRTARWWTRTISWRDFMPLTPPVMPQRRSQVCVGGTTVVRKRPLKRVRRLETDPWLPARAQTLLLSSTRYQQQPLYKLSHTREVVRGGRTCQARAGWHSMRWRQWCTTTATTHSYCPA